MVFKLLEKVFSSANERSIKQLRPDVAAVNALESSVKSLSDAALQAKTAEFRTKLDQGAPLDSIRHEAFAVAREASWRVLDPTTFKFWAAMSCTQAKSPK